MKNLFFISFLFVLFSVKGQNIAFGVGNDVTDVVTDVVQGISGDESDSVRLRIKGVAGLNLSQTAFENWSSGGENSLATNSYLNGGIFYRKNKIAWDNELSLEYGALNTSQNGWRKNSDNIDFSSKFGYQANPKLFYTALIDFKSQFSKGFNYPNDSVCVSKFMAPAYSTTSIGLDYKQESFSAYISPITGRFTFVLDNYLSHIGAYGVDVNKKLRKQVGAYTKLTYNGNICKNVNLISKVDLFTAYDNSFGNVDVNWENLLNMKITKYLTTTLSTILKYDNDVKFIDSNGYMHGARIQFNEILGIGLATNLDYIEKKNKN
jgi:hypothetical protein